MKRLLWGLAALLTAFATPALAASTFTPNTLRLDKGTKTATASGWGCHAPQAGRQDHV
jgi:hypothetical protein